MTDRGVLAGEPLGGTTRTPSTERMPPHLLSIAGIMRREREAVLALRVERRCTKTALVGGRLLSTLWMLCDEGTCDGGQSSEAHVAGSS